MVVQVEGGGRKRTGVTPLSPWERGRGPQLLQCQGGGGGNSDSFVKIKAASLPPQGKAEQLQLQQDWRVLQKRKSDKKENQNKINIFKELRYPEKTTSRNS